MFEFNILCSNIINFLSSRMKFKITSGVKKINISKLLFAIISNYQEGKVILPIRFF